MEIYHEFRPSDLNEILFLKKEGGSFKYRTSRQNGGEGS